VASSNEPANDPATEQVADQNQQPCTTSDDALTQAGQPAGEWPIEVEPATALEVIDLREGNGTTAEVGDCITVHYRLSLGDGTPVEGNDTFATDAGPISFELVEGGLIEGWIQGIPGLKEGGLRRLIVPPALAYGETERSGIPPSSTLVFDVELVKIEF